MKTFPRCRNCGWEGVSRYFTLGVWCDDCARAGVKVFASTIAVEVLVGLVVAFVVKVVLG